MFRGYQALPTAKNQPIHPYARRRIRRHTWQAAVLVVASFLVGLVAGVWLGA